MIAKAGANRRVLRWFLTLTLPIGQESFWLSVIGRLMETKLLQLLRFKAGDVYSVSVGGFFGAEAPSREGAFVAPALDALVQHAALSHALIALGWHTAHHESPHGAVSGEQRAAS
jgi:hypothetical protein